MKIAKSFKRLKVTTLGFIPFIKFFEEENNDNEDNQYKLNEFFCSESFRNLATSIRFLNADQKKSLHM